MDTHLSWYLGEEEERDVLHRLQTRVQVSWVGSSVLESTESMWGGGGDFPENLLYSMESLFEYSNRH